MQHTPSQPLNQFAHILQQELFPSLEAELGPLSPALRLLSSIIALAPLHRLVHARRAHTGRPAQDRTALADRKSVV